MSLKVKWKWINKKVTSQYVSKVPVFKTINELQLFYDLHAISILPLSCQLTGCKNKPKWPHMASVCPYLPLALSRHYLLSIFAKPCIVVLVRHLSESQCTPLQLGRVMLLLPLPSLCLWIPCLETHSLNRIRHTLPPYPLQFHLEATLSSGEITRNLFSTMLTLFVFSIFRLDEVLQRGKWKRRKQANIFNHTFKKKKGHVGPPEKKKTL